MTNRVDVTLLNEHDVARIYSVSIATVRRWRLLRRGPKFIKLGAAVRYRPEDVTAWLDSRPTGGESSPAACVESAEHSIREKRQSVRKKRPAK